jgi:hypothetical protein
VLPSSQTSPRLTFTVPSPQRAASCKVSRERGRRSRSPARTSCCSRRRGWCCRRRSPRPARRACSRTSTSRCTSSRDADVSERLDGAIGRAAVPAVVLPSSQTSPGLICRHRSDRRVHRRRPRGSSSWLDVAGAVAAVSPGRCCRRRSPRAVLVVDAVAAARRHGEGGAPATARGSAARDPRRAADPGDARGAPAPVGCDPPSPVPAVGLVPAQPASTRASSASFTATRRQAGLSVGGGVEGQDALDMAISLRPRASKEETRRGRTRVGRVSLAPPIGRVKAGPDPTPSTGFVACALPAQQLRDLNEVAAGVVQQGDLGAGDVLGGTVNSAPRAFMRS